MIAVTMPNGYNGHTERFDADFIERDGNQVKLHVAGSYLIAWKRAADVLELLHALPTANAAEHDEKVRVIRKYQL